MDIGDRRGRNVKRKGPWVIAHKGVKRGLRSRGMSTDVVGKLGGREVGSPIVLSD